MTRQNKYAAKAVSYDVEQGTYANPTSNPDDVVRFDSILEYNVYRQIVRVVKPEFVTIHKPLLIWTASDRFPDFTWTCDFQITLPKTDIYVEAKGIQTDAFKSRLRAIDKFIPEVFDRLLIVSQVRSKVCGMGKNAVHSVELDKMYGALYSLVKKWE
jgi:hypothetical protein